MKSKLHIKRKNATLIEPRVGGKSLLPKNIVLPKTTLEEEGVVDREPALLFSIPIKLLKNLNYSKEYQDYYCSVFFNCDLENYEYISIMQDFYRDEYIGSIVVIHKLETNNRDDACFEPPYLLDVVNASNSNIEWVQDKIEWEGYSYICEFDTLEIDKLELDINLTFDSAIGYLFIKDNWKPNENCGAFLLQNS